MPFSPDRVRKLLDGYRKLAQTPSWSDRKTITIAVPDLLDPEADKIAANLEASAPGNAKEVVSDIRRYLLRCRTIGVAETAAEYDEQSAIPPALSQMYQRAAE